MANSSEDLERLEGQASISFDLRKAEVLRKRMLKLCLDQSLIYSKSGEELLKQKQYKKARQKFKRSILISPDNPYRYDNWATALYYAREFEEAIMVLENYHEKSKYPENVQNTTGICFLHLGDYENAIRCFQKAISIKASYEVGHFNWALVQYLQGKKEEALEMIKRTSQTRAFPVGIYQREVDWLKEDLEREENKILEDFIKTKIEGFEYLIETAKKIREERI